MELETTHPQYYEQPCGFALWVDRCQAIGSTHYDSTTLSYLDLTLLYFAYVLLRCSSYTRCERERMLIFCNSFV